MRLRALPALAGVLLSAAVPAYAARVEIILDVSGSMRASLGPETRIDAARKAIRATLAGIQSDSVVALRLYGHRVSQDDKAGSCRDTELVVPFEPVNRERFLGVVDRATPRGQTPLTYSVEQAVHDFGPANDEERVIIVVTDGAESCGGDPAGAARALQAQGFKLKVHTVGFDVDAAARAQLEALSQATGGEYHDARNAAALAESLTRLTQKGLLVAKADEALGQAIRGGDGYDSAVQIQPGTVYRLDHHQRKDQYDYFYVAVTPGQKVTASVETPAVGIEIVGDSFRDYPSSYAGLTLQDGARNKLGAVDIIGDKNAKKGLQGTVGQAQGGRLYVLIGNGYHDQHKDARFVVNLEARAGDAGSTGDAGGTEAEALAIKPGAHKGILDADDTADYFKFKADPEATYRIRARAVGGTGDDFFLSVDNPDSGFTKEENGINGQAAQLAELKFPKGGDVFVRIRHFFGGPETVEYTLEIAQSGGSKPAASGEGAQGSGGGVRAFFQKLVSVVLWTGAFAVTFAAGGGIGYLLGRRRR